MAMFNILHFYVINSKNFPVYNQV